MKLPQKGYYIITNNEGRYGAWSEDIFSDWNSHLMLKRQRRHPLGRRWRLQFIGNRRIAFNAIDFPLPPADKNYGLAYCENCGLIYLRHKYYQRFCKSSCRINFYQKQELMNKKRIILEKYHYKCASGENCKDWGALKKLRIWWKGDGKPYCYSCFFRNIPNKGKKPVNARS